MIESALDRLARVLGEHYDGSADPIDTPNNFARARGGIVAVLTAMRDPTSEAIDYLGLINPDTGEVGNCRCDPNIVMEPRPEPDTLFRASAGDTLYSLGDGNLCVSITATRDLMFGMSDADEAALKEVVARLAKRGGAL